MRICAPFGFYGWGNIGDESTLQGFAELLARSRTTARVWVGSHNPAHTARVEPSLQYFSVCNRDPRRWYAKLTSTGQAIIGGTPIQDIEGDWPLRDLAPLVRSARFRKTPLAFIGVGTETLRADRSRRIVAEEIAPRVRHWSVRCEHDLQRLVEYGVTADAITVAADMAWLIDAATPESGQHCLRKWGVDPDRPLIGVNIVNENSLLDRQPRIVDSLAAAIDTLADRMDARVVFLANEVRKGSTFDTAAAMRIIGKMRSASRSVLAPAEYFSPQQMMSIIGCCSLTISMRYHFCLFSALQRRPFIAIARSDKVADLCWDIDWPATVSPGRLDAAEVVEHGLRLREGLTVADEQLKQSILRMKARALRNVSALHSLRSGRSGTDRRAVA